MITTMGPPLPPAQLGHSLGPRDARVVLGGHLDYVVRRSFSIQSMHASTGKMQRWQTYGPRRLSSSQRRSLSYMQCPYSKKTYGVIRKQVAPHYRGESFRFVFHHQVQP